MDLAVRPDMVVLLTDAASVARVQTYKGWAFVGVTAALFYGLLLKQLQRWHQEVSVREQAEAATRRYKLLANHSRDIILLVRRADGRILEANQAAITAYGFGHDELLRLSINDLQSTHRGSSITDYMAGADDHGFLFEAVYRRKDGSTLPVEISWQGGASMASPRQST
jgi:PAS domain S-box-containing protein